MSIILIWRQSITIEELVLSFRVYSSIKPSQINYLHHKQKFNLKSNK